MEQIETLFDFNYDDLPDLPLTTLDVVLEKEGHETENAVASGSGIVPESAKKIRKKRQSKVAQLGEGEGSIARSSPRTRREVTVVPEVIVDDDDVMTIEPDSLATPKVSLTSNGNATPVIINEALSDAFPVNAPSLTPSKRAPVELEEVDSRSSFLYFESGLVISILFARIPH